MGEPEIRGVNPTSYELARENTRVMFGRQGPVDPVSRAMEGVAENINSMDTGTRDLLQKIVSGLQSLEDVAVTSGTEQARSLSELAKEAADEFGRVYATGGGVTSEDVEGLAQKMAETVAGAARIGPEAPGRLQEEIVAARGLAEEFAHSLQEAVEEVGVTPGIEPEADVEVLVEGVEAVERGVEDLSGKFPEPQAAERAEREQAEVEAVEREEAGVSLAGLITGGISGVIKGFMPSVAGALGFIVGGVYALRDEIKDGVKWLGENWMKVPAMMGEAIGAWWTEYGPAIKEGWNRIALGVGEAWGDWWTEYGPHIKDWIREGAEVVGEFILSLPSKIATAIKTWGEERAEERELKERRQAWVSEALAPGAPSITPVEEVAVYAAMGKPPPREVVERARESRARQREAGVGVEGAPTVEEAVPAGMGAEPPPGFAGREDPVRALLSGLDSLVSGLGVRRTREGPRQETPASFDDVGAPDDQGLTLFNTGLAGGGIQ